jgi:hypothetical protein
MDGDRIHLHIEHAATHIVLQFQSIATEQEWYDLLGSTRLGLTVVYIFNDIGVLDDDLYLWSGDFAIF